MGQLAESLRFVDLEKTDGLTRAELSWLDESARARDCTITDLILSIVREVIADERAAG